MNNHAATVSLSFATFWDTIDNMFFTPDFATYEYMTFFNSPNAFKLLVLGLYFGIVLAALCMYYNKRFLGNFVRRLDSCACLSPESAMTLEQLSYGKNILIKLSLLRGYSLRKTVACVEGESTKNADNSSRMGGYSKNKLDFSSARFYLPKEKRDVALMRFDARGSSWVTLLLTAVVGILVVVAVFKIAPFIVGFIENALAGFSSEPDVLN